MGDQSIQEAVAEYQACVQAATEVYHTAIAEAERNLRLAMDATPATSVGGTVAVDRTRLEQLETVAKMVANNPELFSQAKVE